MDSAQLKLLAGRLASRLAPLYPIKHGHALDLIAAIPGLRNWPEVLSFPDCVARATLDDSAYARVAQRLGARTGASFEPEAIRSLLGEEDSLQQQYAIWPAGPKAGIYVTDDPEAIKALVSKYEANAGGAPLYGERAAPLADSAIDLGDYGVFSGGLLRVPSGTLIVLGPIELAQDGWNEETFNRLSMAVRLADEAQHRVAILFETPAHDELRNDVMLLMRHAGFDDESDACLRGVVSEDGALLPTAPFVTRRAAPQSVIVNPSLTLPSPLGVALTTGLSVRRHGVVLVGSLGAHIKHSALLEATLPYTEHAGPVARIQPTFRIGYDNDEPLSDHFAGVPVLPSVESAYISGYRRMVLENTAGAYQSIMQHANDVCFHVSVVGADVVSTLIRFCDTHAEESAALRNIIAVIGYSELDRKGAQHPIYDAMPGTDELPGGGRYADIEPFVSARRTVRWEDALNELINSGQVTAAKAKKELHWYDLTKLGRSKLRRKPS